MKLNTKQGFTLIELLVVIAIIGILASVVLASLNSARSGGTDAKIKSEMSSARAQAELYYNANGATYSSASGINTSCASGMFSAPNPGLSSLVSSIETANGAGVVNCRSTATAWAMQAALTSPATTTYFCVDSSGSGREVATALPTTGTAATVCPAA